MGSPSRQGPAVVRSTRAFSIRARLMVLAVIAIVPLVLERVHNERFDRNERMEAAHKEVLGLARRTAAAQYDVIVSTRTLLQVLASTRVVSLTDPACSATLKSIAEPDKWIKVLSVANQAGKIVCSSNQIALGLDIGKRAHFINAIRAGHFVLSDYFMGTRDVVPFIVAALPQRNSDGVIESVVLATLDLNWIAEIAGTLASRPGSMMLVIDGKGTVLARQPNMESWVGRRLADDPLVKQMLTHSEGVVEASLGGKRRLFAYVDLPGTNAHVAFGLDENEVLGRVDAAMWLAFAQLGAVACLVLLSIWYGAERLLVRPIRMLAAKAGRIGRGHNKAKLATLPWAAEFVPLAVALDDMTEKLDAREQELHDINDQLRELAQLDTLTCLANRRTFNAQLQAQWKSALKRRQPLSVLMIDVDHFKPFNDRYGHVQGDVCLRKVGEVLKARTKARSDMVTAVGDDTHLAARYGGEEFAVLLPGTTLKEAAIVGERLRRAVEDLLISHAGAPAGFLSISVGVASGVPNEHGNPQDLTEAADACLYAAKQRGRNAVVANSEITLLRAVG